MGWPLSLLASSLLSGMTLTPGNRSSPLAMSRPRNILVYFLAAIQIFGGVAIQWPRTARVGAYVLGSIYLIFALLWVPRIAVEPRVYDRWGNFFEQFSLVAGALIAYASLGPKGSRRSAIAARIGYLFFGICVVSFTVDQIVYLSATASYVPKWIPPGQMFWAISLPPLPLPSRPLRFFRGIRPFWRLAYLQR